MLLLASNLAEARLKYGISTQHFMQYLVIFMATTAFLVPVPPFSVVVENLLETEDMASFLFRISCHQLCPYTPFYWLEIPLKDFHAIHQIKMIGFFIFLLYFFLFF